MDEPRRRRQDDRDQMLNTRLEQLEEQSRHLAATVSSMQSELNSVKQEQTHTRELLTLQIRSLETTVNQLRPSLEQLSKDIQSIGNDEMKSPVARRLQEDLEKCQRSLTEYGDANKNLTAWQNKVDGVLGIVKFLGPVGLVATAAALWKAFSG